MKLYKSDNIISTKINDDTICELFENYDICRTVINYGFTNIYDYIEYNPILFINMMMGDTNIYNISIMDWINLVKMYPRLYELIYNKIISVGDYSKNEYIRFKQSTEEERNLISNIDIINTIW